MRLLPLVVAATIWMGLPARAQVDLAYRSLDLSYRATDLIFVIVDLGGASAALQAATVGLEITDSETEIRIELAADVLFDFDSADLRPEAEAALQSLAAILRDQAGGVILVEGHTDSKGSDSYNQALSEMRAEAVRNWLVDKGGLGSAKIATEGIGESRPAAANEKPDGTDDPEARARNRRVEIIVEKL